MPGAEVCLTGTDGRGAGSVDPVSRIIAGSARGRRIGVPAGDRTRPTTDRVREALFSALTAYLGGADAGADAALAGTGFLDLYAGSGAVGLEAASRGAAPVVLVESERRVADVCRRNAAATGLAALVRCAKVETFVAGPPPGAAFDVIWLDPPYETDSATLDRVVGALVEGGWLDAAGLIVLERSSRSAPPRWPHPLGESWSRRYGETTLYFACFSASGTGLDAEPTMKEPRS